MADAAQPGIVGATQVAGEVEIRRSTNGVRFATFGETGVEVPDLASMVEAVPPAITAALTANTYYFVPLALRETDVPMSAPVRGGAAAEPSTAMVASSYTAEVGERAICHRNVAMGAGEQGVFISTRLMGDRFALCFEFFINVAHAFADEAGVPERFAALVWSQAVDGAAKARGETSLDAFEARNLALGLPVDYVSPDPRAQPVRGSGAARRSRAFAAPAPPPAGAVQVKDAERATFVAAAFSDALAIYLLSLCVDFDYSELRERDYPLLEAPALAARLRLVAELYPPNAGYEFAVRYRRRG